MTTNLMTAHNNWASRPVDERFETVQSLTKHLDRVKKHAKEVTTSMAGLRLKAIDNNGLIVDGSDDHPVTFTNTAFSQLCRRLNYPVAGLVGDRLPADMVANVINYQLDNKTDPESEVQMLLDQSSPDISVVRSVTSERYSRIFSADLMPFLQELQDNGWKVPPARPAYENQPGTRPATKEDVLENNSGGGLEIKEGDLIAPGALFAGTDNMFASMVNTSTKVDDGTGRLMSTGIMLSNDEIGTGSLSLTKFQFAFVCSNLILWDAVNIVQLRYRHIGEVYDKTMRALDEAQASLRNIKAEDNQAVFDRLRKIKLGEDVESVIESIYKRRLDQTLTQKVLREAYHTAEEYKDIDGGNPNTPWGIVQGLTRYSQSVGYADSKFALDKAGGKILSAFAK